MNGRLQFIHQSKIFPTREVAKEYVVDYLIRNNFISLLAEPMVVLYGEDESKPNVLLVIGTKTNIEEPGSLEYYEGNGYFFIDSKKMEDDIIANKEAIDALRLDVEKIYELIDAIQKNIEKIQSELDNTQKGAGLAEDGSYVKNESFENRPIHYIVDAESLNDADVKLDIALQELDAEVVKHIVVNGVEGEVKNNVASVTIDTSDINLEPDFESVEPELKEDGHLHLHSGDTISMAFAKIEKTYYNEKVSREDADAKLREDLDAEIVRATSEEDRLEGLIREESDRAKDAEEVLQDNLDKEITRATGVEDELRKDLDAEITRAKETESGLRTDVDSANSKIDAFLAAAEVGNAAVDTLVEIQHYIEDHGEEAARMVADIAENRTNIANEVARSTEKDAQHDLDIEGLRRDLNNEITRSTSADDDLNNRLANEVSTRESNVSELNSRIDNEAATRQSSDDALGVRIDNEAFTRQESDNALNARIDTVVTRIEIAEGNLSTEELRAKEAEAKLRTDFEASDAQLRTDFELADVNINSRIDSVEHNLSDEIIRATEKETVLDAKISDETDRAKTKEDELKGLIDTEVSRATIKEDELASLINDEFNRATSEESRLDGLITDERLRAIEKEGELSGQIISLQGRADTTETDVENLEGEIVNIKKDIQSNKEAISAETTARLSADTELDSKINILFDNKVEKEDGKGLSANDFTDILLEKLNLIEDGSQVNKIEKIFIDDVLLDITDNKEVKITMPEVPVQGVNVDDNILSLNGVELSANVNLTYDKDTKQIILYGKDNTKVISTVDVTDFVKDGMIKSVEVVTLDSGKTVIRITWNTDGGDEIIDVPADSLIQIYESGDGLIKIDNRFSIKLNTNVSENFLRVSEEGLYTEGIKQFVFDSLSESENKTNEKIVNLSQTIANTQTEVDNVNTKVLEIEDNVNELNTDLSFVEKDVETVKVDIESLKTKTDEVENLAKNSFKPEEGDGIILTLTPGTETDRTNVLTGSIKGYYTYATRPETEKDSDYSLLRMTEDGYIFVTNSTSAMKHIDADGNPQVLSTFVNTLKLENATLSTDLANEIERAKEAERVLTEELNTTKDELAEANARIEKLETMLTELIAGQNTEFMTMLRKAIINEDTFKDESTDPTVEVIVTEGESVVVRTREDAVYEGSILS